MLVAITVAELTVLSVMLGGLLRKRSQLRVVPVRRAKIIVHD
jgi:hypothetical protein